MMLVLFLALQLKSRRNILIDGKSQRMILNEVISSIGVCTFFSQRGK